MLSRLGTEIIHVQLFAIPAFHLFWIGLQRGRLRWFVASGAIIGAAQYISPNARFIPITAILMILLHPAQRGRALRGLLLAGVSRNHCQPGFYERPFSPVDIWTVYAHLDI